MLLDSLVFSQTTTVDKSVTLNLNEVSLIDVLKTIEKQTDISFVYNTTVMKNAQKMCIDVNDFDLNTLLQTICNKSGNNYKVINNQVVFYKVAESSNEAIKILSKPEKEKKKKKQTQKEQESILQSPPNYTDKINSNQVLDTVNKINDAVPLYLSKKNEIRNIELSHPILPKASSLIYTSDSSRQRIKDDNFVTQHINMENKAVSNKFFLSLQSTGYFSISPGFISNDSLTRENASALNRSISSYGYSGTLYVGYTYKHFSYKTGIKYTQLNDELTEDKSYNQFSKQTDLQVITWKEQNSDGITVHYDTIPTTQTSVNDSTVTTNIKYTYSYIEIPFYIDYTFNLNSKWRIFSSLGFTYAISLKNNVSELSCIYKPSAVNKLNISGELNIGLKRCTKSIDYYLKAGGIIRSTCTSKNNLIKRNPVYTNISIGIINYF